MENVVLIIHLILALMLIGVVLMQQSEGGALGMGGGGNFMSGRGAANALQKATWWLAGAFIATSMILALFAIDSARDEGVDLDAPPPPPAAEELDPDAAPIPSIPSVEPSFGAPPAPPAEDGAAAPRDAEPAPATPSLTPATPSLDVAPTPPASE